MTARPRIRLMTFGDVGCVGGMMKVAHGASRYAKYDFDQKAARALLTNAIQRTPGSQFAAVVAPEDGGPEGFIIGVLQPLYFVIDAVEATDLFWYAKPGAHGATAARLLKEMHKWAADRGAHVIRQGNTDAVTDTTVSGAFMRRAGMRQTGAIFEKEIGQ